MRLRQRHLTHMGGRVTKSPLGDHHQKQSRQHLSSSPGHHWGLSDDNLGDNQRFGVASGLL